MKNEILKMGVLTAVIAVAMPEIAFATPTLGDMMTDVGQTQLSQVPFIVSGAGYVIGSILILSGALSLKKHSENPAAEPLGKGIGRLVVGAGITAIPALLGLMQKSSSFDTTASGQAFKSLDTVFTP